MDEVLVEGCAPTSSPGVLAQQVALSGGIHSVVSTDRMSTARALTSRTGKSRSKPAYRSQWCAKMVVMETRIRLTVSAYADDALVYSRATADYSVFPGLIQTVDAFMRQAKPEGAVVDLGCGGGRDARFLAANGYVVTAVDLCEPLLRSWAGNQAAGIQPVVADMRNLPLGDSSIDAALAIGSLVHLNRVELRVALAEVLRVLTPGGHIAITTPRSPRCGWTTTGPIRSKRWFSDASAEQVIEVLRAVGFRDLSATPSGPSWLAISANRPRA